MFIEMEIGQFLSDLASEKQAPGGGAAAALAGSMGAALVGMVCRLTLGKAGYEPVTKEVEAILALADGLKKELVQLMDEDARVFKELMGTFSLPKNTEAEKTARRAAISQKSIAAAEIPAQVAKRCLVIMELTVRAAGKTNVNLDSDLKVAMHMATAGMHSALVNIKINLGTIKDPDTAAYLQVLMEELLQRQIDSTRLLKERLA